MNGADMLDRILEHRDNNILTEAVETVSEVVEDEFLGEEE